MLRFFYQTVLPLSLAGSVTMLLLLALTPAMKRLNSTWQYYVRLIAVVLFLVPFSFQLPSLQHAQAAKTVTAVPVETLAAVNEMLDAAVQQPPMRYSVTPVQLLAVVWAAGALLFMLYKLFVWLRFCKLVKQNSVWVTDSETLGLLEVCKMYKDIRRPVRLAVCGRVGSPMLTGILHPTILLPRGDIPKRELRLILMHELTHSKHYDLLYKLVVLGVGTVHWFNPLVHLLAGQVNELCELSCDEAVVRRMNVSERKAYGFTILNQINIALCKTPDVSSGFSEGKQHIKRRLHLIMNFHKSKKQLMALGVCVVVALSATGIVAASALNSGAETPPKPATSAPQSMPYSESEAGVQKADVPVFGEDGLAIDERGGKTLNDKVIAVSEEEQALESKIAILKAEQEFIEDKLAKVTAQKNALQKNDNAITPEEIAAAVEESKQERALNDEQKAKLEKLSLILPVDGGKLLTGFWNDWGHTGNDIGAKEGTDIYAAAGGTVAYAGSNETGYGNYVIISHGDGVSTLYGHCKELLVKEGDVVEQGDMIATVGRSGNATDYHCHVELRVGAKHADIYKFI